VVCVPRASVLKPVTETKIDHFFSPRRRRTTSSMSATFPAHSPLQPCSLRYMVRCRREVGRRGSSEDADACVLDESWVSEDERSRIDPGTLRVLARRRDLGVDVGKTSSGGTFSPSVRMSFAILRRRVSTGSVGVTGELSVRLNVGDRGDWREVRSVVDELAVGRWSKSIGRARCDESPWDVASLVNIDAEREWVETDDVGEVSTKSGVSPNNSPTLRVERIRRRRCA